MRKPRRTTVLSILPIMLLTLCASTPGLAGDLIVDGDFEQQKNGADLRKDGKGPDWYESRKESPESAGLLKLSRKDIGGNATQKAMIKADPERNTYLSQRFTSPQDMELSVTFDIFVREILPEDNRSAFVMLGAIKDKKGGPNSTGKERFAFLGFENAETPGRINLFAREGKTKWSGKTAVVNGLELEKWYTIRLEAHVLDGYYTAEVVGVADPFELDCFYPKGHAPDQITHLSFASWNDGAGTFYVDNVVVQAP